MSYRPVIRREPGSTEEVLTRAYKAAGGPKSVEFLLKRGKTQIHNYTNPNPETTPISLDDARGLATLSPDAGAVFAEDFAASAGGYFVPGASEGGKLGDCFAIEAVAHGKMLAAVLKDIDLDARGELTVKQQRQLRLDILDVIRPLAAALPLLPGSAP